MIYEMTMSFPPQARWSVASAKARLSSLLVEAQAAPQIIERRGREVAVVLGAEAFASITGERRASPVLGRWRKFLRTSASIRGHGGATISLRERQPRPSPFGATGRRR